MSFGTEIAEARKKIKEKISKVSSDIVKSSSDTITTSNICNFQQNDVVENINCFISKCNPNVFAKMSLFYNEEKDFYVLNVRFNDGGYVFTTCNSMTKKISVLSGEYCDEVSGSIYKQGDFISIPPQIQHSFRSNNCILSILFE